MSTLFKHIIEALQLNKEMGSDVEELFDGFVNVEEAVELYSDTFEGQTLVLEMQSTMVALRSLFDNNVECIYEEKAQSAISKWNIDVWGQDYSNNEGSVPFGG